MKNSKRIISMLLALLFVLSVSPVTPFAIESETTKLEEETYEFLKPIGSAPTGTDVREINNKEDLIALSELVYADTTDWGQAEFLELAASLSATYVLKADIDLTGHEWQPIGKAGTSATDATYAFKGVFDGQGHIIKGLNSTRYVNSLTATPSGLFGLIAGAAEIKNVGLVDSSFAVLRGKTQAGEDYTGFVQANVGAICGVVLNNTAVTTTPNTPTIYNCFNAGNSNLRGSNCGGILGSSGNFGVVTIESCYNTGRISPPVGCNRINLGGIVGLGNGASVKNSYNTGKIGNTVIDDEGSPFLSPDEEMYRYAGDMGGIIGSTGTVAAQLMPNNGAEDCYNTGDILAEGYGSSDSQSTYHIGGIIGTAPANTYTAVTRCYNTGNLTSTVEIVNAPVSSYVGGIQGNGHCKVSESYNTGALASPKYAGGILGAATVLAVLNLEITDSYNLGSVTVNSSGKDGVPPLVTNTIGAGAGGIAGLVNGTGSGASAKITNCYNKGNVSVDTRMAPNPDDGSGGNYATAHAGGIVGQISFASTSAGTKLAAIEKCYSIGNVSAAGNNTYAENDLGAFTSTTRAGGIVGSCEFYSAGNFTVTNCFAAGEIYAEATSVKPNVSADAYAGGIVGNYTTPQTVVIKNNAILCSGVSADGQGLTVVDMVGTVLSTATLTKANNLIATPLENGTITATIPVTTGTDTTITLTAVGNEGYSFEGWYEAGVKNSSPAEITVPVVDRTTTLEAKFEINKYDIKVEAQTGGTFSLVCEDADVDVVDKTTYDLDEIVYGTEITVTAKANNGVDFIGWYDGDELLCGDDDAGLTCDEVEYTFNAAKSFTLTAKFVQNDYGVTIDGVKTSIRPDEDGNVTVSEVDLAAILGTKESVLLGIPFTEPTSADEISILNYTGVLIEGDTETPIQVSSYDSKSNTMLMKITKAGKYGVVNNQKSFTDVAGHWAETCGTIPFVTSRVIFKGDGEGIFSPDVAMTRAMFVTALARLDGVDLSSYETSPFVDVSVTEHDWAYQAIAWAAEKGIVNGTGGEGATKYFTPDREITREEMAKAINAYIVFKGLTFEVKNTTPFEDEGAVSPWATVAVKAIREYGLAKGSNNYYHPQHDSTRAEVAQLYRNFIELIVTQ